MSDNRPVIGITAGDPCGIGPEIVLKALTQMPELPNMCRPVVFCEKKVLEQTADRINIDIRIHHVDDIQKMDTSETHISVYDVDVSPIAPCWGHICAEGGNHAFGYIKKAIEIAKKQQLDAIVTAPVNKEALKLAGIPYLDHTEMLTVLTDSKRTMTLFIAGRLRIFFLTRHIAFRDIADRLNIDHISETSEHCIQHLKKIGIDHPKLALAALNPHGGEHGLFGREEMEILIPAVSEARQRGINIDGPIPADSVFQLAIEGQYDAVLSLYHDQGHIAAKTYDFYRTVSLTMGLPFLRTSVDHGTAMSLAGKNLANPLSMIEAIKAAVKYHW